MRVCIIGLNHYGSAVSEKVAKLGVESLTLAHPVCSTQSLSISPQWCFQKTSLIENLISKLRKDGFLGRIDCVSSDVTQDTLRKLVLRSELIIVCSTREVSSIHYSLNELAVQYNVPIVFTVLTSSSAFLGPVVLPTYIVGCYRCYRMRRIAAESLGGEAVSYEESQIAKEWKAFSENTIAFASFSEVAEHFASQTIRAILSSSNNHLKDSLLELLPSPIRKLQHPLLPRPDCPICIRSRAIADRSLSDSINFILVRKSVTALEQYLVSPLTGIVRQIVRLPSKVSISNDVVVVQVELSNSWYSNSPKWRELCFGTGKSELEAKNSALGEAVERYAARSSICHEVVVNSRSKLLHCSVNPRDLVLYASQQYSSIQFPEYSDNMSLAWVKAKSLIDNADKFVPACAVFADLNQNDRSEILFPLGTNGLASANDYNQAALNALLEVLERDAFLISWLNRLATKHINYNDYPNEHVQRIISAIKKQGLELHVIKFPTDHCVNVFGAILLDFKKASSGPIASFGLGAALSGKLAVAKAIFEVVQVRTILYQFFENYPHLEQRARKISGNPQLVKHSLDHSLYYARGESWNELQFLFNSPTEHYSWKDYNDNNDSRKNPSYQLRQILKSLRATGAKDVLLSNITPSDLYSLGLWTIRALVLEFQPLHHGYKNRRLGGERLFNLPIKLCLKKKKTKIKDLNDSPHPLG